MPRQGAAKMTHEITERLEQVSVLLLLPVFFVVTGSNVDIGAIDLMGLWELALILLVAISGKFVGAFVAARFQGVPRRQATALGVLMNTRGLTELVILNIGAMLGVLDGEMFTLMVIMAVVTTMMAAPLLNLVYPQRILDRDIAEAERLAMGLEDAYTVVVVVDDPARDAAMVRLACDLVGRESPAQVVVSRVVRRTTPKPEVASGLTADLALLAEAGDELRQLSRLVDERGLKSSIASRFSDTPWMDVAEIAAGANADVVLVRAGWGVADGATDANPWPASLQGSVVVVSGDLGELGLAPSGPVAVVQDTGADGRAALRLAAQAAVGRSVPLKLEAGEGWRAGRRAAGIAESLRRAGVDVAPEDSTTPAGLLFTPPGEIPGATGPDLTPVLTVHAGPADRDRDMDETLAEIAAPTPGQA
jgi:hypothetical protein